MARLGAYRPARVSLFMDIGQGAGKGPVVCYGAADQEIDRYVGNAATVQQGAAVPDRRPKALVQHAVLESILIPRAGRSREAPGYMVPFAYVADVAAVG